MAYQAALPDHCSALDRELVLNRERGSNNNAPVCQWRVTAFMQLISLNREAEPDGSHEQTFHCLARLSIALHDILACDQHHP